MPMIECRICENYGAKVPIELLECPSCGFDLTFVVPVSVEENAEEDCSNSCVRENPRWKITSMEDSKICLSVEHEVPIGREVGEFKSFFAGNPYVSRKHAIISFVDGNLFVTDCGSTNGTYLNDKRITPCEQVCLNKGDILAFANMKFRVDVNAD